MDSTRSAFGMTDLEARRAHDTGDFTDSLWLTLESKAWANASGTALAGPDGDRSPAVSALRAASLSQGEKK